jgi:vancomycin resistance protein YoaR
VSGEVVPAEAGLGFDLPATLDKLTGVTFDPRLLWQRLRGSGGEVEPVTTRDDARLAASLAAVAETVDRPVVEGAITFSPEGARLKPAVEGRTLDQAASADLVADRWLEGEPVELVATSQAPKVSPEALQRTFDDFARPATSGPLTVLVGDRRVVVPVRQFAPLLSVTPKPAVDAAKLERVVNAIDPQVERTPVNARIVLRGSRPTVIPAQVGQRLDPAALGAAVLPALTNPQRTARVAPSVAQPDLTTAEAQALGVRERVSTFTTRFPNNPPRTTNIRIAARRLDGVLVRPGEVFSLNETLGRRTPAKGYQQAPVIESGRLVKDYGGGVSQVSTTLFNAVFFAGLDVVTHKPHSFYISRYPEGREATLSYPTVDQKFRNDSGHGILIDTQVGSSTITVTFYGTKVWDIDATKGPRTNLRPPETIRDSGEDCVSQSPQSGFDVTVTRVFAKGGQRVRTERFFTRYNAEDRVICS